ncbi:Alpha/Beta hydrolase protein [Mycena vulgaris]|nr:Alpha/Beta hydrolase protein [Mycena vulgaris]
MAQYAHLSILDPEFKEVMSKMQASSTKPGPPDLATLRHQMRAMAVLTMDSRRPHLPAESAYRVSDRTIPVDEGEITIRCIQPVPRGDETAGFPVLVWLHGGGWVAGDLDIDDFRLRILSVECRLAIVNVDYRLAPEHQFPTGLNDCYAALKWAAENALGPDISGSLTSGFMIGGASAGANYAAAIAHRARDDPFFKECPLTGHILQIPALLHPAAYPEKFKAQLLSMEQNKDAPILSKANFEFFLGCLHVAPSNPEFSSLLLSHDNLSPAYIQVAGLDPLRDDGLLYEQVLRDSGVQTKLDIYPGVPHAFHAAFPQLKASEKWAADLRAGIQWLLSGPQLAEVPL